MLLLRLRLQYLEYNETPFTITDSPYGTTFFVTTGFHGMHVSSSASDAHPRLPLGCTRASLLPGPPASRTARWLPPAPDACAVALTPQVLLGSIYLACVLGMYARTHKAGVALKSSILYW